MGLVGSLGAVAYDIIMNDKTSDSTKSAQQNMMAVGVAFTGVGVASKLMVDDVNSSFLEFDNSMTAVKAVADLTDEEFQRMEEAAIGLSTQVPISATDVSDAMYKMVSVGYDFNTMMATIPEATKLAVGGNISLAESVDSVINVFGAYGTEMYDAADVTNIMSKAVGVGKWELGDFTTEIMKNIGVAAQLGISFEDLAAANVLLQNKFTSAEEAGTALKTMLLRLVDPNVQKQLEDLGIQVKDNEGNFVGLESVLNQLDTVLQGTGGDVDKMAVLQKIFGTEGLRAAMALIEEKDKLKGLSSEMNDATFKEKAYNTVLESTGAQLEIAKNKMEAAKIMMGDAMAPATVLLADATSTLASGLMLLPEPLQQVAGMGLFAAQGFAVLGPALMGLAALKGLGLATTLGNIATGIGSLGTSALTAFAALGPLGPVLVGLALGLGVVYAMKEVGILDWVGEQGKNAGSALSELEQGFYLWRNNVLSDVAEVVSGFEELPNQIINTVTDLPNIISGAFGGVVDIVGSTLSGVPGALAAAFTGIVIAFSALGGSVQSAFTDLFTGISEFIVGLAQGFVTAGYNIIMYIVQGMQSAAGAVGSVIGGIFDIIGKYIPHSPAETGPLSQLPNFGAYFVDPLLATVPAVNAAATQVAAAVTMPVSQPASIQGGSNTTTTDDHSMNVGTINAGKEQSISDIMAEIAAVQAVKRTQRGITTG